LSTCATWTGELVPGDDQDIVRLLAQVDRELGPPHTWGKPDGYPDSLAMCLIDAIWSLGLRYKIVVVPLLNRYREYRRAEGADPDRDSPLDLLGVYERLGGAEAFAGRIGTRNRTSTRPVRH